MRLTTFQSAEYGDRPLIYVNPAYVQAVVPGDMQRAKDSRPDPMLTKIVLENGLTYLVHSSIREVVAQLLED